MATTNQNQETGESALTEKQKAVVSELPGTSRDIADELGCSTSAIRHRIERINSVFPDQNPIFRDEDGLYVWDGQKPLHRTKTHHTGTKTRKVNNFLTDDEAGIKSIVNNTEPATCVQNPTPEGEDVVIHLTDLHYGDKVTNHKDQTVFDADIADERVLTILQKALKIKRREDQFRRFDTCHLLLGGDMITNEITYDSQWEDLDELCKTIKEQINRASEILMRVIKTLAEEFETLQVISIPGNHGEMRASGSSKQANADINVYSRLEFAVSHTDYDNIHFQFHDSTSYTNFEMRGGEMRGHLRHGENCLQHAGATSASKRDWRGWLLSHEFDTAWRGHYHESKRESVHGVAVLQSGSIKPPADFEESISEWSGPSATICGVSDEQCPTWSEHIEF